MYLAHLLDEYGRQGRVVHLQHVKGHAGEIGNEGADRLAGVGAAMPAQPEQDWTIPSDKDPKEMGKDAAVEFEVSNLPHPSHYVLAAYNTILSLV